MGRKKEKLDKVAHIYILSNEVEEKGLEIQGHPWLHSKLKDQLVVNETLL